MKRIPVLLAVMSTAMLASCGSQEEGQEQLSHAQPLWAGWSSPGVPPRSENPGVRGGVVAVAHPIAAAVGAQVLKDGGNAIDAAAAVQLALNVVEPQSSGVGGGGFMMIHLARTKKTLVIDCRERAPAAATPEQFTGMSFGLAATSGLAVGVPGTLLGVATALENHGTISLAQAIAPAINLAEEGFVVGPTMAARIASTSRLDNYAESRDLFKPGGVPLQEGDLLVQPDLARTFKLIASQGVDVFYRGEIAEAIVAAQQQTRAELPEGVGRMALSDLANYEVAVREPTVGNYRGYTIKSMSPPSSGGLTVVQMLKLIEQFPIGSVEQGYGFGATKTLHVMLEAMRLAYQDRAVWMGDDDFVPVPTVGLIDDDYIATRAPLIDPDARMEVATASDPRPFDPRFAGQPSGSMPNELGDDTEGVSTTHFSIVDRHGNVVSYTTTIEGTWGTGIMVPGYGFLLNNELTDFNFTPRANPDPDSYDPGANDVAPFKRPRSSMAPTMLFRGKRPVAAYGSPGGSTIINSVLNITLNLVDHGMSIQEAIDAPRISRTSTRDTGTVAWEEDFDPAVLAELEALGHGFRSSPSVLGSVQAIVIDLRTGRLYGGADARRVGAVEQVGFCEIDLPRRGLAWWLCRLKNRWR